MKKAICLLFAFLLCLCGCSQNSTEKNSVTQTKDKNTDKTESVNQSKDNDADETENAKIDLINVSGVDYSYFATEGFLYYLGKLEFVESIPGEEEYLRHLGSKTKTGMYAIKNAENRDVLIRITPDSEWFSIYRKASLPKFDFSVENCVRLEFVKETDFSERDISHASCGNGITDKAEIAEFLSEIRKQKDPNEAGLYDLVKKPDGKFENCYTYGAIYGFFAEEPYLITLMDIRSYNDLAYSIMIDNKEYVLPKELLQKIMNS